MRSAVYQESRKVPVDNVEVKSIGSPTDVRITIEKVG